MSIFQGLSSRLSNYKDCIDRKIIDWSEGLIKDKNENILSKYKDVDNIRYMNPYPKTLEEYTAKSFALARKPAQDVDFYIDVEYGVKSGKGLINMQRIDPKTLEILYYNNNGLITDYTQIRLPVVSPLLIFTKFIFVPVKVYR